MNEIVQSIRTNNWAAIIQEQKRSGLSIRQWCSDNNISEGTFYYRLRQLREMLIRSMQPVSQNAQPSDEPVFVKVPDSITAGTSQGVALKIRKGTTIIEVSNDASDRICSLLKEVLPYVE